MAQGRTNLQPVSDSGEELPTFTAAVPPSRVQQQATDAVFLALRALSARAVIALGALTDLALIGTAFALWLMVIRAPSVLQLVGVGGYAIFILCAIVMRHRRQ